MAFTPDQTAPNNGWSVLEPRSDGDFQQRMTALLTPGNMIEQADGVTEEIYWFVFLRYGWRSPVRMAKPDDGNAARKS